MATFRSADQPDSVLTLLRNHVGFTDTHVSKLARICPEVLSYDPKTTLLPKLEFFRSTIGIPTSDLATILSNYPTLLARSLNDQLIPVYNYLKTLILLDDKQIRRTLKNSPWFFYTNFEKRIVPKITALRALDVPASSLSLLVTHFPYVLLNNEEKFDEAVKEVVEMGVNPLKTSFVLVLKVVLGISKSTWEHKVELFKKCGWSKADFQLAFEKGPICMSLSEEKITSTMDFLVVEMGWKPAVVAWVPKVLTYSLNRRIIPRCLVFKVLISKGLIKEDACLSTVLVSTDKYFLGKFVTKYEEDVPQLLDVFNGIVGRAELGL